MSINNAGNSPTPESSDRPSVLVAEDDDQISFLLQFLLEREGYDVTLARDGREAMQCIDGMLPPNLVIMDVMMPHMDGFELLEHLRAKPEWNAVPVMMMSARSQEEDIRRALDAGASDYVIKPFLPEELKQRIHQLTSRQS